VCTAARGVLCVPDLTLLADDVRSGPSADYDAALTEKIFSASADLGEVAAQACA
jgi:hypothetical protein